MRTWLIIRSCYVATTITQNHITLYTYIELPPHRHTSKDLTCRSGSQARLRDSHGNQPREETCYTIRERHWRDNILYTACRRS